MEVGPRRPSSTTRAEHAELLFASRATELGWIWHPVLSGRDVGIDGRVELVSDGSVSSDEFTVQVKSGFTVDEADRARVADIRLSTLAYWHRKLPPTLIVAVDVERRRFAFEWAHNAIGRGVVQDRIAASQKTMTLTLSEFVSLDADEPWREIERYAHLYFTTVRSSLAHTSVRGVYIMLYVEVCDVIDILVDWVSWIAYADAQNVLDRFVEADHHEYDEAIASFAQMRISPGDDAGWRGSISEPMWAIGALAELHKGFLSAIRNEGIIEEEGPLEAMAHDVCQFLASTNAMMMTGSQPLPTGHVLAWGVAPVIAYGVGLTLVSLRDWAHLLRNLLFEVPEETGVITRWPGGNADRLHRLANAAPRPAPDWIAGVPRPIGPAWDRYGEDMKQPVSDSMTDREPS